MIMEISISHIRWEPWALDNNTNNACMHTHTHMPIHKPIGCGGGVGGGVDMTVKDRFESVTEQVSLDIYMPDLHACIHYRDYAALRLLIPVC